MTKSCADMKDWDKFVISSLSFTVNLFMNHLQAPFLTVLFSGFMCEENPAIDYGISDILCDGTQHKVKMYQLNNNF